MVIPHGLPETVHPFLITGPPRSGTSMLSGVFTRASNVFCVNEPDELHRFRMDYTNPNDLVRGFMIQSGNRLTQHGTIVTKTRKDDPTKISLDTFHDGGKFAALEVDVNPESDVYFGVKFCRPIIDRIAHLAENWNRLRFVVTVRDPYETLRSWKNSFGWDETLRSAKKAKLDPRHKSRIEWTGDLFDHHAQLWTLLVADAIDASNKYPDRVLVVRYNEVVSHPEEMLSLMLSHIGVTSDISGIDLSDIKPRDRKGQYDDLSNTQRERIAKRCDSLWKTTPVRHG